MSDALNYLVKARPDAIGPYLAFLKQAGTPPRPQDTQPDLRHHQGPLADAQRLQAVPRPRAARGRHARRDPRRAPDGLPRAGAREDHLGNRHHPRDEYSRLRPGAARRRSRSPAWHDVAALADLPADGVKRLEVGERGLFVLRTPARDPRLRQPLPAPGDEHPRTRAQGPHPHLPQARVGVRPHDAASASPRATARSIASSTG